MLLHLQYMGAQTGFSPSATVRSVPVIADSSYR